MIDFLNLHYQGCLCSPEDALWTFEHFCVGSTVVQWSCDCCTFIGCESAGVGHPIRYVPFRTHRGRSPNEKHLSGNTMQPVHAEAQQHSQPFLLGRHRDHFNPTIVISDVPTMRKGVQATHA